MHNPVRTLALVSTSSVALCSALTARSSAVATADTAATPNSLTAQHITPVNCDYVQLDIAYDPFDRAQIQSHELQWRADATINDYLDGLPEDTDWMFFVNGVEIDPTTEQGEQTLKQLDRIGLVLIPQGGNMKSILRVALMAVSVAISFIPGMQWWAAAAIMIGIGLVNTFLLTPKPPKSQGQDTSSYGIDGAKNSSTEGIPYPVVYGDFRCAGNFADVYTENVGDDQFLYVRTVMNDGEIEDITDIEINEQPIANFKQVETRITKGTLTEEVNSWFPSSIVLVNKGIKLDTSFTVHTTTTEVDKLRLDVTFPSGLTDIKKKDGTYGPRTVEFQIQYRKNGDTGAFTGLPLTTWSSHAPYTEIADPISGILVKHTSTIPNADSIRVTVDAPTTVAAATPIIIHAKNVATNELFVVGTLTANPDATAGYVFDPDALDGSLIGPTDITPMVTDTFIVEGLPAGDYQIIPSDISAYVSHIETRSDSALLAALSASAPPIPAGTGSVHVTDKRTRAIRKSFYSSNLPRDTYDVQIRRVTPVPDPVTHDDLIDEVYLTDIGEVENDPVALRGTATLSLSIKLNEQLNALPQLTALVKGSKVRTYDISGTELTYAKSKNPAWISLDILCGIERGAGFPLARIDWPRWLEWAQYCTDNNLEFNGVFDTGTTLGDALVLVMRIGHAAPVPFGTKISCAVDKPREPVHVFTQANIIKDTFGVSYLSMADRANEYEFSYFDKTDRNKQKTLRYVDPNAVIFNEVPRAAQVTLTGVDNHEQARTELWRAIYQNRLLVRTVTFDAWLDAMNMVIGEVALIQHDMMEWGNSGRLMDGSDTTHVVLDQKVTMSGASNVLVHYDAMKRVDTTVAAVAGRKVMIVKPGGAALTTLELASKRLICGSHDYEIAQIQNGATYHTVTLADDPIGIAGGNAIELWDTDCLEERSVTSVADNANGTTTLTLASPLPQAPAQFSYFAFGPINTVKKPYTLIGVSGNGLEKRTLTFVEYNEGVYAAAEVEIPIPIANLSARITKQVGGLMMEYDTFVDAVRNTVGVRIFWNTGGIINYGGADVYMAVNGGQMQALGSAVNLTELHATLNIGDEAIFKVIAYNTRGDRAPFATAPMIGGTIDPQTLGLPAPDTFTVTQTGFDTGASLEFAFIEPLDTTAIIGYEINYKLDGATAWIGLAQVSTGPVQIENQTAGDYQARIRSVGTNGGFSDWLEISYLVTHPDITAAPVGLRLNGGIEDETIGEFQGRDAIFSWTDAVRDEVYFLDYQVTIFDDAMVQLRQEFTTTPAYTYSYDKNAVDGGPRRAFNFEVRQRGRQGQISDARAMFATNPAPVFTAEPVVTGVLDGIQVSTSLSDDTDLEGIRVYATLADPCTTSGANLVYQGKTNQIIVRPLTAGAQHYIIVVPYDAFGNGSPSLQHVVLPLTSEDLFDSDAPAKVTGLALSSSLRHTGDGSISPVLKADWDASVAGDFSHYEIEAKQGAGNYVGFQGASPTYEWPSVVSGVAYTVRVRAVDDMGNKGLWSDEATHTIVADSVAPAVPTGLVASASFRNIFLTWESPADSDLKAIIVYENTVNTPGTATPIATIAAIPSQPGAFTRSDLIEGQSLYYWISAIDTSGNESTKTASVNATTVYVDLSELNGAVTTTQIADNAISTPKILAGAVVTASIAAGAIVSNHITVGTLTGDRILAGSLEGAALSITTALPASITVGTTGVSIGTVQTNAATGAQDPVTRINAGTTLIEPGKVVLTGTTTLASVLWGGDLTKIDGGAIAANTILANKIEIGVRGITVSGIEFEHNNPATDRCAWTAGTIAYVDNSGTSTTAAIAAGNTAAWTSGTIYVYWGVGDTALTVTTSLATASAADRVILATYRGGHDLNATYGRTVIDGTTIKTGTITADRMNVSSLSAISATIGTFQTAGSGQRVVITDSLISVYDASDVLRVRLGVW